jgi:hypothetical protein
MGPFALRHFAILLAFAAHLGASVAVALQVESMGARVACTAWVTVAAMAFLVALVEVAGLELGEHARACWRRERDWARVQIGATRREVIALLGPPVSESFEVNAFYALHPLCSLHPGTVTFDGPGDQARVVSKRPLGRVEWRPPGFEHALREGVVGDVHVLAALGLVALAIASSIPVASVALTCLPVAALVLVLLYEKTATPGWRFDACLLFPIGAIILGAWLVRVR